MMDEVILSVSESKRLIAKGVASWPPILERFRSGMIVIAKGTTNRYVAEELLGESLGKHRFAWGIVAPPGTPRIRQDIPEIVIVNGSMTEMDFEDAIDSMSPGDIFVKGGNALNYGSRTAGVLSTSSTGGTIGRVYPRIFGSRIRLLIPTPADSGPVTSRGPT